MKLKRTWIVDLVGRTTSNRGVKRKVWYTYLSETKILNWISDRKVPSLAIISSRSFFPHALLNAFPILLSPLIFAFSSTFSFLSFCDISSARMEHFEARLWWCLLPWACWHEARGPWRCCWCRHYLAVHRVRICRSRGLGTLVFLRNRRRWWCC